MSRNLFEWACPPGASIIQTYGDPVRQQNGNHHRQVFFVAVCDRCGHHTSARAARADALDDLEAAGHPCPPQ